MRNRGHTRQRRGCLRIANHHLQYQPGRLYLISDVLPSRQLDGAGIISPHILVSLICTGLLMVLPSRQFHICESRILIFRFFRVFRVHVYNNHRYSESHRCKSRAQASISVKSVLSVFEKKNKKQIYPIYLISIPKTCRASISDTSDTSASLITSASEIICLFCVFRVHININHRYSGSHRCQSRAQATKSDTSDKSVSFITSASEHIPLICAICVREKE